MENSKEPEIPNNGLTETNDLPPCTLKRHLNLPSAFALILGTVIGSGIFITPGLVLQYSGSVAMSLIIWISCGFIVSLASLSYIELGMMLQKSGGEYSYLLMGLGRLPSYLFCWISTIIIRPVLSAIVCKTFGQYAVYSMTMTAEAKEVVSNSFTVVTLLASCFFNCWSVTIASRVQNIFTVAKLTAVFFIIIGGIVSICMGKTSHILSGFSRPEGSVFSFSSIALSFDAVLVSYEGWNQLNYVIEEIKNPTRNFHLASLIAIPTITILYFLINVSYLTVMSPQEVINSTAVAIMWTDLILGEQVKDVPVINYIYPVLMPLFVALSCFGASNGILFSSARLTYVASRDGDLSELLSYIHVPSKTPAPAIIFTTFIAILLTYTANVPHLIQLFSFTSWSFHGGSFLALVILRFTHPNLERPFKVWVCVPILLVILSSYLTLAPIIDNPTLDYFYIGGFIMLGVLIYILSVIYKLKIPHIDKFYFYCRNWFNLTKADPK